jgi:lactoylglutathione lyase
MHIDHIGIWTSRIEELKDFYIRFFNALPNEKYINKTTGFESYFLSFETGIRLELMKKPGIPENLNDTLEKQHLGIIHLAFDMSTMEQVNQKCVELSNAGFRILRLPRKTGDGYYEFETHDPDNNRIEVTTLFTE